MKIMCHDVDSDFLLYLIAVISLFTFLIDFTYCTLYIVVSVGVTFYILQSEWIYLRVFVSYLKSYLLYSTDTGNI